MPQRRALLMALLAALGGPALGATAPGATDAPASPGPASDGTTAGSTAAVSVETLRPDVYMLTASGIDVALETGPEGGIVVDPGPAQDAPALIAAITRLSHSPVHFVIDTSADADLAGGSAGVAAAGTSLVESGGLILVPRGVTDVGRFATIVAREAVLQRLAAQPDLPAQALPSATFSRSQFNFYLNGQAIEVIAMPPAHSDSDAVVLFRRSDVVVTGAIFDPTRFPVIDTARGGSVQGELEALDRLINTLVITPTPVVTGEPGTLVVPMRGPVCQQADLVNYRDMVATVRMRVETLVHAHRNLVQIEAADVTQGYDRRFGALAGTEGTRQFVEAVYRDVTAERRGRGLEAEP